MAYTKIHEIKTTLKIAVDYISNPDKTENKTLITSFACGEITAAKEFEMTKDKFGYKGKNLAYHAIQSFKVGEVTPELAHQIGIQTADELLKGRYEYVVTTHVDKQSIHNHIMINSCSFIDGKGFGTEHDRKNNRAWKQLREISDIVCAEHGLSVIQTPEKGYSKSYYEWLQDQKGFSYKGLLKKAIDRCILSADSFEDFLKKMEQEHYTYKLRGNTLSFKSDIQERYTRCSRRNFGWYYEPEQIRKRIERQVRKRSAKISKENGIYQVRDESAVGLSRWAMVQNMQIAADALSVLTSYGVHTIDELEEKIDEKYKQQFDIMQKLNDYDTEIKAKQELLQNVNSFWETKPVHDEFVKLKGRKKEKFREDNRRDIAIYEYSESWLRKNISGNVLPAAKRLEKELSQMKEEQGKLLKEYKEYKEAISKMNKAHEILEQYLAITKETDQHEHEHEQKHERISEKNLLS